MPNEIDRPLRELFDGAELNRLANLIDDMLENDIQNSKTRTRLEPLMQDLWYLGNQLMSNGCDYGVRAESRYRQ